MTLEDALEQNIVTFSFKKLSTNSHRTANGTRDLNLIPKQFHPKSDPDASTTPEHIIKFFDWDKKGWRSCSKKTIFGAWDITEDNLIYRIDRYKELGIETQ